MAVTAMSNTTDLGSGATASNRAATGDGVKKGLVAGLSVLGAIGASACCVIPFGLFMLGVSGAWIGNLTALAPYKPLFVVGTLALLALGFYLVYRRPRAVACADGSYCARRASNRIAKIGLGTGTLLVLVAVTLSFWFPLLVQA